MKQVEEIAIVGVGARTAVGLTAPSSAAAVRAGITRIGEHPYMIDKAGEPMIVSRAAYLSDDLFGTDRLMELAMPAIQEALGPFDNLISRISDLKLILGLPAPRPGLPANFAEKLIERMKPNLAPYKILDITTISCGHSAGLMAIQAGYEKICNREVEFCLAGGIDSYIEPETLEWLDAEEQLHSEQNKWGFAPGEAAGYCLLTSRNIANRNRIEILGNVLAVGTAREKNLIKTDTVCIGEGLTDAFKQVLTVLQPGQQKINQIICDLNGERYRADEYGFTIARTSEYFIDASDFLAPADCWGDVGAASGPLFCSLAIAAGFRGYARGPLTLVWTSSESGERSAVLLHTSNDQRN